MILIVQPEKVFTTTLTKLSAKLMKSLAADHPDIGKAVNDLTEALADKDPEARRAAAESIRNIAERAAETTMELQQVKEELARTKQVLADVIAEKSQPEKKMAKLAAQHDTANKELDTGEHERNPGRGPEGDPARRRREGY